MRYALLVAWREFSENARTKGFWIGIFLTPALIFLMIQMPMWLDQKATPVRYYVLLDKSGSFERPVESGLERVHQRQVLDALRDYARKNSVLPKPPEPFLGPDGSNPQSLDAFVAKGGKELFLKQIASSLKPGAPPFQEPRRRFQRAALPADVPAQAEITAIAEALKPYLRGEKHIEANGQKVELSAAVLIPRDIESHIVRPGAVSTNHNLPQPSGVQEIQFWTANASDPKLRDEIERTINSEIRSREYLARGMDGAVVRQIEQTSAPFTTLDPKKESGREAVNAVDVIKHWAPSGFVYLLWLSIFVVIQMLLNNTIEEKSNRIIEVLLSSVTPGELMMGKLFGIAAIGLTMIGAWMAALFGILSWKAGGTSDLAGQLLGILKTSNLIPVFAVYFLLGYLMYAAFILSIGCVCNSIKEAQSYMGIVTMIMMVPLLTMTYIPKDPNGPLARVLSWIPLYTPFTMMNRAAADPPLFDKAGTLILLLASTLLALWMSGKIFRIGILRAGQPPKLIEMVRWALRREK